MPDPARAARRPPRPSGQHRVKVIAVPLLGGRKFALEGLAWCALDRRDVRSARRHATAAVREAEPLGDEALRYALHALVVVYRAEGDLDAAAAAATRLLDAARRLGGHEALFYVIRSAADLALDRGELGLDRDLLTELDAHAAALDSDTGTTTCADQAARHHRRLTELNNAP